MGTWSVTLVLVIGLASLPAETERNASLWLRIDWTVAGVVVAFAGLVVAGVWQLAQYGQAKKQQRLQNEKERQQQARDVELVANAEHISCGDGSYVYGRSLVQVTNYSNRSVVVDDCYVVTTPILSDPHWSPWRSSELRLGREDQYPPRLPPAGGKSEWDQPPGCHIESSVGDSEHVVVEIRDSNDIVWWKRSDDPAFLAERYPFRKPPSRVEEFLVGRTWVVSAVLQWLALRAITKRPDGGPPWSWRLLVGLGRGVGPGGAFPDPILDRPPPDWPAGVPTTLYEAMENPNIMNVSDEERAQWKQNFSYEDPSTWPLWKRPPGLRELRMLLADYRRT